MIAPNAPAEINEDDLDHVTGAGLMDTPVGGWGKGWSDHNSSDPGVTSRAPILPSVRE